VNLEDGLVGGAELGLVAGGVEAEAEPVDEVVVPDDDPELLRVFRLLPPQSEADALRRIGEDAVPHEDLVPCRPDRPHHRFREHRKWERLFIQHNIAVTKS